MLLKDLSADYLCPKKPTGSSAHVAFHIKFTNEKVLGDAGPYRQLYNDLSAELMSETKLSLFIATSNNKNKIGEARNNFYINNQANSIADLLYFKIIGKLLAIALRTKIIMNINLSSIIWKYLTNTTITLDDLELIDFGLVHHILKPIYNCQNRHDFQLIKHLLPEKYHLTTSTGELVQLTATKEIITVPNANIDTLPTLSWLNCKQYANDLLYIRLNESNQQLSALKVGFNEIIPIHYLSMLNWKDVEIQICGASFIDLNLLKKHTEYAKGYTKDSLVIQNFWLVLHEFNQEQLARFIKFCYASERLPLTDQAFDSHPRIRMLIKPSHHKNPDSQLPHAETCFFNITLPAYSSIEIMRERLLLLINISDSMSGDDNQQVILPGLPLPDQQSNTFYHQ